MTSRVRRQHLEMADHRAMEEQRERENPVNEKHLLSNRAEDQRRLSGQGNRSGNSDVRSPTSTSTRALTRGNKTSTQTDSGNTTYNLYGKMKGRGATPSMGLSMYRGGGTPSEAFQMGQHLGAHLHQLHGGAYHQDFCDGMSGSGWFDSIKNAFDPNKNGVGNAFNKVKNEFVNPNSVLRHDVAPKVANEFTDPNSVLRGQVIPIGAQVAQYAQPFIDMGVPGLGTAINTGFKAANYANKGAKMLGYGEESRAKAMLGMNKKGRSRNNGVPLQTGSGFFDSVKNYATNKEYKDKISSNHEAMAKVRERLAHRGSGLFDRRSDIDYKAKLAQMKAKRDAKSANVGKGRMVGAGIGAGMLEEPMPMPGNNLSLSGYGTGAYEGQGRGGQRRRPGTPDPEPPEPDSDEDPQPPDQVSDSDDEDPQPPEPRKPRKPKVPKKDGGSRMGRVSARAAIVKKVMAEKGLKMIEASKYVKAHNLY